MFDYNERKLNTYEVTQTKEGLPKLKLVEKKNQISFQAGKTNASYMLLRRLANGYYVGMSHLTVSDDFLTLLDKDFILRAKKAKMGIGVSFDGTAQKISRKYKDGSDTFKDMERVSKMLLSELLNDAKKRGIKKLKVVYSKEPPVRPLKKTGEETVRRDIPGSTAFVPSAAGLIIAGEVIRNLAGIE